MPDTIEHDLTIICVLFLLELATRLSYFLLFVALVTCLFRLCLCRLPKSSCVWTGVDVGQEAAGESLQESMREVQR